MWGSVDLACLCMPCAGVCGAVYLLHITAAGSGTGSSNSSGGGGGGDGASEGRAARGRERAGSSADRGRSTSTSTRRRDASSTRKAPSPSPRRRRSASASGSAASSDAASAAPAAATSSALRAGNAARLARRGLLSNLLLGDFVEACYPFTLPSTPLLAAVRTGASLAGAVLFVRGVDRCLSSAYLPLPLAMWAVRARGTSSDVGTFIAALAVAFVVPFVAALIILRGRTDKTL